MPLTHYSEQAILEAAADAGDWLSGGQPGYPRSLAQEHVDDLRRGYVALDDPDGPAPSIIGFSRLEELGLARRVGVVRDTRGDERVRFEATALLLEAG